MSGAPAKPRSPALDLRSAFELIGGFVVGSALFSSLSIDLVQRLRNDPGYRAQTLLLGVLIGTAMGLGLTLLAVWAYRRGSGRRSQRLGRQAWRSGLLPTIEPDRTQTIADLRRRRRALDNGLPPVVMTGIWTLIGVLQVATSDSALHTTTWVILTGVLISVGVRGMLDKRRLPQLEALLDQVGDDSVSVAKSSI